MEQMLQTAGEGLHTLAVFRGLLAWEPLCSFARFLDSCADLPTGRSDAYCAFVASLYNEGGDFGQALLKQVVESDNPAVHRRAEGLPLGAAMESAMKAELALFSFLSALAPADVAKAADEERQLPLFENTHFDFGEEYSRRLADLTTRGHGIFAAHHMFTLGEGTALLPVHNPDPQHLSELTGYEREREPILVNTRALLRGLPANNILLYGDAGTGKSSTVKALANEYRDKGLRLVEIRKNQLYQIPALMDALAKNPLKFILFIDDLSFPADDGDFTSLKAILEGNISARPRNIVVYATSNRRQMVQMRFSDRQGDDIHLSDTLEEEASLAARFGLTVTFLKPDCALYEAIVASLAAEYELQTPLPQLLAEAEAHAIRHGGRSPRTARQFAEYKKAVEADG